MRKGKEREERRSEKRDGVRREMEREREERKNESPLNPHLRKSSQCHITRINEPINDWEVEGDSDDLLLYDGIRILLWV